MPDLLEFEEPIGELLKEIEALATLAPSEDRDREIARLEGRVNSMRGDLYRNLTPWQRVQVARHPTRPTTLDYVERLFTDFVELHGDRRFADDHAIVTGTALYKGQPDPRRRPSEGQRHQAEDLPQLRLRAARWLPQGDADDGDGAEVQAPDHLLRRHAGRVSGIESEERGVAEAIAVNLREMAMLEVPVIVLVHGEGGSGGALGIAVGDRILMHEFAIYSVIPPEGCAAILWRDPSKKVEASAALKITAPDLLALGIIDEIVNEPVGGAHTDPAQAARAGRHRLVARARRSVGDGRRNRLNARYDKFRKMGSVGIIERL